MQRKNYIIVHCRVKVTLHSTQIIWITFSFCNFEAWQA